MEYELGGDRAVIIVSALVERQKTTLVQRSAFAETTCFSLHLKLLQLLNGEMSWKENSSLLRLWPYQGSLARARLSRTKERVWHAMFETWRIYHSEG